MELEGRGTTKKNRNIGILGVILLVVIVAALVWFFFIRSDNKPTKDTRTYPSIVFSHPSSWVPQPITAAEKSAGLQARLRNTPNQASLTIRTLQGQLDKNFDISTIPTRLNYRLEEQYPDYKLISKKIVKIGPYQAVQINFTRSSDEYLQTIIPRPYQTFYITFTAPKKFFDKIKADTETIDKNFTDYLASY